MNKHGYLLMSTLLVLATGCTKNFGIDPEEAPPQYVIEGRISNMRGPYYVRVTKTSNVPGTPPSGTGNAEAVKDALVIMTDDMGLTDTLKPMRLSDPRYNVMYTEDRGYYGTTKLTGMPGHTYYLWVHAGNQVFKASAYVPAMGPAIDSAVLKADLIIDPRGLMGNAAFIYFKEPRDAQNYYQLQLTDVKDSSYDAARAFDGPYSIAPAYVFDDKALPPYVEGMEVRTLVSDGVGMNRLEPHWINSQQPLQVRLSSMTRHTYDYFKALEKQFLDDGNTYRPTPASASGNISGGALGLFWAVNVSHKVAQR